MSALHLPRKKGWKFLLCYMEDVFSVITCTSGDYVLHLCSDLIEWAKLKTWVQGWVWGVWCGFSVHLSAGFGVDLVSTLVMSNLMVTGKFTQQLLLDCVVVLLTNKSLCFIIYNFFFLGDVIKGKIHFGKMYFKFFNNYIVQKSLVY